MEECLATASAVLGRDLKKICQDGPIEELTRTEICQVALFTVGYGIFRCLQGRGFGKDLGACLGLSLGEWTALAAAEVIDFADGVRLVMERARWMQRACEATSGAMASLVGGDRKEILALCRENGVEISNYNAPDQVVISGERQKIQETLEEIGRCGVRRAIPLAVAGAYHSRLMESAREGFAEVVAAAAFKQPKIPVLSNVSGRVFRDGEEIRRLVVEQITAPVQWETCMQTAASLGVDHFYECGSGKVLVGLAKKNSPQARAQSAEEVALEFGN
jgi:[acyl-carrier-protein] S-malonyltransferase